MARATSAAPTYFPPAHITNRAGDGYWFVDGGVFANNPSIAALSAAKRLWPDAERIVLLSLGTGTDETPMSGAHAAHWGDVMWLSPILSILLGAGPDFAVCEAYDQLGDDHVRLDTGLGKNVASAFDDASAKNIAALEALAQQLIGENEGRLSKLCDPCSELNGPASTV